MTHVKTYPDSQVFPVMHPCPEILGSPRLRQEVLAQISSNPFAEDNFHRLSKERQEELLGFCMGNRGLKVTYDPFFQHLFHPYRHKGRLDRLLSCILNQEVQVMEALPRERTRIGENSSLMVMDILVRLGDGALANLEMQKLGYNFPGERAACYGADLLVRQYDHVREQRQKNFSYRDMRPIYVIVLMEESSSAFHQCPRHFLHHSHTCYDTGLELEDLINFVYIPLDIFLEMPHNGLTELVAWLYFLSSDSPRDVQRIIEKYPFFRELYQDIVDFRYQPKELITMYSEALRIMDENTVKLMIDEWKEQIDQMKEEASELQRELSEKKQELSEKRQEISENKREISRQADEIAELRRLLQERDQGQRNL